MNPSSGPETLLVTRPWLRLREVRLTLLAAASAVSWNAIEGWTGYSAPLTSLALWSSALAAALAELMNSFRSPLRISIAPGGLVIRNFSWTPGTSLPGQWLRLRSGQQEGAQSHWIQFFKGDLDEAEITGLSSAEAERILDRVRSEFHLELCEDHDGTVTYATWEQWSAQKAAHAPADLRCSLCQEWFPSVHWFQDERGLLGSVCVRCQKPGVDARGGLRGRARCWPGRGIDR